MVFFMLLTGWLVDWRAWSLPFEKLLAEGGRTAASCVPTKSLKDEDIFFLDHR